MQKSILVALTTLALSRGVAAWGNLGHEAVGYVAMQVRGDWPITARFLNI